MSSKYFTKNNAEFAVLLICMFIFTILSLIFMRDVSNGKKDGAAEEAIEDMIEHFSGMQVDLTP